MPAITGPAYVRRTPVYVRPEDTATLPATVSLPTGRKAPATPAPSRARVTQAERVEIERARAAGMSPREIVAALTEWRDSQRVARRARLDSYRAACTVRETERASETRPCLPAEIVAAHTEALTVERARRREAARVQELPDQEAARTRVRSAYRVAGTTADWGSLTSRQALKSSRRVVLHTPGREGTVDGAVHTEALPVAAIVAEPVKAVKGRKAGAGKPSPVKRAALSTEARAEREAARAAREAARKARATREAREAARAAAFISELPLNV